MAKIQFSDHESYLIENWADVRLLTDSLESIQEKYIEAFDDILGQLQDEHKGLDCPELRKTGKSLTNVGIGKATWSTKKGHWTSGLWFYDIGLENLISEDEDAPCKGILVNHPEGTIDLEAAERKLRKAANDIFTTEEVRDLDSYMGKGEASIWCPLSETRSELLGLVLNDGGRGFIEHMVAHFASLTHFVPVIDEIFRTAKRSRK